MTTAMKGQHGPAGSLEELALSKLDSLQRSDRRRSLRTMSRRAGAIVNSGTAELVSFACNDYLGLSHEPDVIAASIEATRLYGVGAGASRLISGNHPLYETLERRLAELKSTEDAIVFGSGYLANVGVIPALVGLRDMICLDELSHSCLLSGAQLSRSALMPYRHNDAGHLESILESQRSRHRRCLILTEGVFSMDGDLAPLPELAELAARYDAWLYCDDAHALGVIGNGRGAAFAWTPPAHVPLQMGTLSKAAGAYGGYLCATRAVCDFVRNRARSLIYSTGLPPGTIAAAIKSLEIIASGPAVLDRPLALARLFTRLTGLPDAVSPIVPLIIGDSRATLEASAALERRGMLVPAIRPPTVPAGTARLRIAFSAMHGEDQVAELARHVRELGILA